MPRPSSVTGSGEIMSLSTLGVLEARDTRPHFADLWLQLRICPFPQIDELEVVRQRVLLVALRLVDLARSLVRTGEEILVRCLSKGVVDVEVALIDNERRVLLPREIETLREERKHAAETVALIRGFEFSRGIIEVLVRERDRSEH